MAVDVLAEIGASIVQPVQNIWDGLVTVIPGVISAILVLIIGYLLGSVLGNIVRRACAKLKVDSWLLHKIKLKSWLGEFKVSDFIGLVTKWYVFVLFFSSAADLIRLNALADLLTTLAVWIPNLIGAIIIAFAGFCAAEYVSSVVKSTKAKHGKIIGDATKFLIIIFVVLIALEQIGVEIGVARNSFLIILSGIVFGLALAFGIGFGLGMKDDAKKSISRFKKNF